MRALELVGCRSDGASALRAIRELAPELVLMDIHMPGMTGLDVLRVTRRRPGWTAACGHPHDRL